MIQINTDCALLIDKLSRTATYFIPKANLLIINEKTEDNSGEFLEKKYSDVTNQEIFTGALTGCMAVLVETKSQMLILHVSPDQAEDDAAIKAYQYLNFLKENSEISVTVFGHINNFKDKIFRKAASKHHIKSLAVEKNSFKKDPMNFTFKITDTGSTIAQLSECISSTGITFDYEIKDMKAQRINDVNAEQTTAKEDANQENEESNHKSCCSMM